MKQPWFHIVCELDEAAQPDPTIRDIQRAVCGRFPAVTVHDVISDQRYSEFVMPRHIAMFLASKLTMKPTSAIAKAFGNRDPATLAYGVRKIAAMEQADDDLRRLLASISNDLGFAA